MDYYTIFVVIWFGLGLNPSPCACYLFFCVARSFCSCRHGLIHPAEIITCSSYLVSSYLSIHQSLFARKRSGVEVFPRGRVPSNRFHHSPGSLWQCPHRGRGQAESPGPLELRPRGLHQGEDTLILQTTEKKPRFILIHQVFCFFTLNKD